MSFKKGQNDCTCGAAVFGVRRRLDSSKSCKLLVTKDKLSAYHESTEDAVEVVEQPKAQAGQLAFVVENRF